MGGGSAHELAFFFSSFFFQTPSSTRIPEGWKAHLLDVRIDDLVSLSDVGSSSLLSGGDVRSDLFRSSVKLRRDGGVGRLYGGGGSLDGKRKERRGGGTRGQRKGMDGWMDGRD